MGLAGGAAEQRCEPMNRTQQCLLQGGGKSTRGSCAWHAQIMGAFFLAGAFLPLNAGGFEDTLTPTGVALEFGKAFIAGSQNIMDTGQGPRPIRLCLAWDRARPLAERDWGSIRGYTMVSMGHGWGGGVWDLGLTPTLRLEPGFSTRGHIPFAEVGLGPYWVSRSVPYDRRLSTAFQFGSFAGVGLHLGPRHSYEIGYKFFHLSNGGIRKPNGGLNFHVLRLGFRFGGA